MGQATQTGGGSFVVWRTWGGWALLVGALAMGLVLFQIFGPSLEPTPSVATQIGEAAGEMRRAAWRSFLGLPRAQSAASQVPFYRQFAMVGPLLGVIAILLAGVAGAVREHWRLAAYGAGLGVAAIVFQFVWWVTLVVAAVILLVAVIENIGDIFGV